ncbi:hypothetical protein ACQEVF_58505 [Nonomuraea polychroma]|uniref:hypothetical protein n=1 Tax=Nonomuraea polychroma TaxID=46176 RepID=UPI003D8B5CC4
MATTPNQALADLMDEARLSQRALGKLVRELAAKRGMSLACSHMDVSRWLSGTRPRPPKPELIAAALGAELGRAVTLADIGMAATSETPIDLGLRLTTATTLLTTTRQLWETDLQQAAFLHDDSVTAEMLIPPMARWLVAVPGEPPHRSGRTLHVTAADVDAVRTTCHMFEELDHRYGGGNARTAAVQYLHSTVVPLLHRQYDERVGRALFAAAAQFGYKVGAMAYDVGAHGLARRHFVQALSLAHASGDRALGGKVLALMSHQATFRREYAEAADLARAAKQGAAHQATATVHAMYCMMEARALAGLGDHRNCRAALREAEQAFERRRPADDPDWIAYFDEAEYFDEFAHTFRTYGDYANAIRHAELALKESSDRYRRSRVFCRLIAADAHLLGPAGQEDVEAACAMASQAFEHVTQLKSARVAAYVSRFKDNLERYASAPVVAEFTERWQPLLSRAA